MKCRRQFFLAAMALAVSSLPLSFAVSCPFCSAPSLTLSEQMAQSDAVVLVEWVRGRKPTDEQEGLVVGIIVVERGAIDACAPTLQSRLESGLVGQQHAVTEHIVNRRVDVIGRHVVAPIQPGAHAVCLSVLCP